MCGQSIKEARELSERKQSTFEILIEALYQYKDKSFYQALIQFSNHPFFLDSKQGELFIQELQSFDEMTIRYENDLKESENRIRQLITKICETINNASDGQRSDSND